MTRFQFVILSAVLSCAGASFAHADRLEAPTQRLGRDGPARFVYHVDRPAGPRAAGTLTVGWTDTLGRTVEGRTIPVSIAGPADVTFTLDLRRVAATSNTVRATLTWNGTQSSAEASFVAPPPEDGWANWQTIMWQSLNPAQRAALPGLGVTVNQVIGTRDRPLTEAEGTAAMAPLLAANLRPYIENIATDFYAAYHRWVPGQSINFLYTEGVRRYGLNPADPTLWLRTPSLSDAVWQARIEARLADHVRVYRRYAPAYYSLGDETGIADLAANWDFDFSPASLTGMRGWLRGRYGSLATLNRQWGTNFASWDAVTPETTDAALARTDGNYSRWSDFKAWMDEAFARAIRGGAAAMHRVDPTARAAIEGGQAPGWGGYDYTRLAGSLDVLEMYDMRNNMEIAQALNPRLITLTTSFRPGPAEKHRIWHEALQGQRGVVIWDTDNGTVAPDGTPGPRGEEMRGLYTELRAGIAAQLIASRIARDPVAILYSPESFRLSWLDDVKASGKPWVSRDSEHESFDSPFRAATRRAASLLQHDGLQPNWLSPDLLAAGALQARGIRVLILPHTLSLSDRELAAIATFVRRGGTVLADIAPGAFDGFGRKRNAMPTIGVTLTEALARDDAPIDSFRAALAKAGLLAAATVETPDGTKLSDVDIRQFVNGRVRIVGLLADGGAPRDAVVRLARSGWRTDLRGAVTAEQSQRVSVRLDTTEPAVIALSPEKLPRPVIAGPRTARIGEVLTFTLRQSGPSPAAASVLAITVRDPAGRAVDAYGANIVLRGGPAKWRLPLAVSDAPGTWIVTVRDALGAGSVAWPISVGPINAR